MNDDLDESFYVDDVAILCSMNVSAEEWVWNSFELSLAVT